MNPKATEKFPEALPMTLDELKTAIGRAKKVVVYVPVNRFWVGVQVAKTCLLAAIMSRAKDGLPYVAEWLDDEVLLVGGEFDYSDEEKS